MSILGAIRNRRIAFALLAVLVMLAVLGWWAGNQRAASTDAEMRKNLLRHATEIINIINPELVKKLTFTLADEGTPAFERIREQMIHESKTIPKLRSIYSMALRKDKFVFGPDNLAKDDKDHAPPGVVYKSPPVELHQSLQHKQQITVGPYRDEWGTYISVFAPIIDSRSGEVLMVLGIDIEARDWQAGLDEVRREQLLTALGLFLILLSGTAAVHWHNRQRSAADLKFKAWIVVPVALALLAAMAANISYQNKQALEQARHDMRQLLDRTGSQWNSLAFKEAQMLRAQLNFIARDPALLDAWQGRNIETLTALSQPIFEELKIQFNITHFNLITPDRTIFLQVHRPEQRGGRIERPTMMTAASTGTDTWGAELDPSGSFTLRYVRPWTKDGKIIGYLELGREIKFLNDTLVRDMGVGIVTMIHKKYISKEKFKADKKIFGFTGEWDDFPDIVVVGQSLPDLPEELARRLKAGQESFETEDIFRLRQGDRIFDCGFIQLSDAAGREVSTLIVLNDVTAATGTGQGILFLNLGLTLIVLLGILALLWSITDRTEHQLTSAFATVRESEERFRSVVERSLVGIAIIDDAFHYTYVNEEFCSMAGYEKQELLGKDFTFLLAEESKLLVAEINRRRQRGEDVTSQYEFSFVQKNGKKRIGEVRSAVYIDSSRKVKVIIQVIDITERKQAEEENQSLVERLNRAEKMEALGTLAGGVAHDLNNVLGVVVGYAELLLKTVDGASPMRPRLVNIMKGGERAAAIVQDLLTLARRGVPTSQVLNLNDMIIECQKSPEFANLSSYHPSMQIDLDLDPELLNIAGSPVHLSKTLFNLASNACEAMPNDGTIIFRTSNQYLDKPIHGYDEIQEGDYVVLSVSDTGEGIPAADLKRIFEPFYTKKVMGRSGTGLGLAVVWGTVKDHQGYINVQSEEGKGSIFTLYFPVTREKISKEKITVAISEYLGKGETILVVDDVDGQRDLATEMLRELNYNVTSVASGEEAMTYLQEHEVDLMVLDMIMDPGMDGLDTYRSVLAIRPQQKAVIVSGFSESKRVNAAQSLGAGAYVRKPYIIEKLGLAVRKELDRHHSL